MRNRYGLLRDIPEPIKRQVRQRCGFGCIICGKAFIEYHHFDPPFYQAREHRAEGITILCAEDARAAHHGRQSANKIKSHDASPKCRSLGHTFGPLDGGPNPMKFMMGSAVFHTPIVLMHESAELISFKPPEAEGAPWRLTATILDRQGKELLKIVDNEWQIGIDRYDITAKGKTVEVRQKRGYLVLAMDLVEEELVHIRRVQMQCKEVFLDCDDASFSVKSDNGGAVRFTRSPGSNNEISGDIGIHVLPSEHVVKIGASLQPGGSAAIALRLPDSR